MEPLVTEICPSSVSRIGLSIFEELCVNTPSLRKPLLAFVATSPSGKFVVSSEIGNQDGVVAVEGAVKSD